MWHGLVLHRCDNPPCCNPGHLFIGTDADNAADKARKGRVAPNHGMLNGRAKLTEADVKAIRSSRSTYRKLAAQYGVSFGLIGHVKRRRNWTHL